MNAAARLDEIEQLFFTDRRQAMDKLSEYVDAAQGEHQAAALRELVKRVDHEHPGLCAYLALAGGALVESGEPAGQLGRGLVAPLVRTLQAAARMLAHVAHLPDAEEDADEDEVDDADEDAADEAAGEAHAHGHAHAHSHAHDHDHDHS